MATSTQEPVKAHRRDVRRLVILPVVLGVVLIALLVGSTVFLTPRQLTLVSNLMLTCICLLPLVVCMTPLYLGAVVAAFGMSRVNAGALTQLERARVFSASLAARTAQATENLNRRAISTSASLARLDPLLDVFENHADGKKPHDRTQEP
jgi:hypothetical protein